MLKIATGRQKDSEEEGSESIEQEPRKQQKKGRRDGERDIGSAGAQKLQRLGKCNWMQLNS